MKHLILSLLFSVMIFSSGMAQRGTTRCSSSISTYVFKQKAREVRDARTESERLTRAKGVINSYCLTSEQVKEIAASFVNDYDRLIFAKAAYPKTFDPENFYDVYDAFAYFSTVFRLHDYVAQMKQGNNGGGNNGGGNLGGGTVNFPNYNYPDPSSYNGPKNCSFPLNNETFIYRYQNIKLQETEQSRLVSTVRFINNQCLSTAQVMKLTTLFSMESNKLNLLKQSYDAVYDPSNFIQSEQVLTQSNNRQDFRNYIRNHAVIGGGGNNYACQVDDIEFDRIKQNIKSQSFNNTRLNTAKQIVKAKGQCFTAEQVREIVKLFDFESSRLDIAKYCYDYTLNQNSYYVVNEAFTFDSSKDRLREYIESKD